MLVQLNDFLLSIGKKEYVPIMLGGMGVDVSVPELALAVAGQNGIGHITDAMITATVDKHFHTHYVLDKLDQYRSLLGAHNNKQPIHFDLNALGDAVRLFVGKTMDAKKDAGAIFLNVMEKLTMSAPHDTLQVRLRAAMDAGIDGITLGAGLHLGSLDMIKDHPRFRDVKLGIIVSSARALHVFMRRAMRAERMPDYIVVEGPMAGGHLGFPLNWRDFSLKEILQDILQMVKKEGLAIPVIAAGGVFTGSDAVELMQQGAAGVQVATRFAVTKESGLPYNVKQEFFRASEEDVVVNMISPTGYPMRMLRNSPAIGSGPMPQCEAFGYILDGAGKCSYLNAYIREAATGERPVHVDEVTCLCTQMNSYKIWTCGQNVFRLKDTTNKLPDGSYQLPTAAQVFADYQFSTDGHISLPPLES